MAASLSYVLCGTPRTGSTLLCSLLASTGVAGRPESYFREEDQRLWCDRFAVPRAGDRPLDYSRFVVEAVRAGSTSNGVFGARIMWGTMDMVVDGLAAGRARTADLRVLTDAFEPVCFAHLQRHDVVAQAVSWARAEQSGHWQAGDAPGNEVRFDRKQIHTLVTTIRAHNEAWRTWFTEQHVEPVEITYEALTADPRSAVRQILGAIGSVVPDDWVPAAPHRRQADEINADWIARYLAVDAS